MKKRIKKNTSLPLISGGGTLGNVISPVPKSMNKM